MSYAILVPGSVQLGADLARASLDDWASSGPVVFERFCVVGVQSDDEAKAPSGCDR